jgi:hypothetical protein
VSAYSTLRARIEAFMALPLADLQRDRARLKAELDRIGAMSSEPSLLNLTEVPMSTLQVFDPPMCCATGVCGPTVDPNVVQFAADLDWLATRGVTIRRFNLAQEPTSFAENAAVKALLARSNGAELPAIVVDGAVVASGRYPTRDELAAFAGLAAGVATDMRTLAPGERKVSGSTCCGGPAPTAAVKAKSCC